MQNIRNFCIIAHIDHGKSTLADRFLEITGTVDKRKMQTQYLDQLELERERGITIKMAPVRMTYKYMDVRHPYILNLIDTPGHSDFGYEVSRALAAVEGAILLVDATQGIQAQTLANLRAAEEAGLTIIGALNKVDLDPPGVEELTKELSKLIGCTPKDIYHISAKTGEGVKELLDSVVEKVPPPQNPRTDPRSLSDQRLDLRKLAPRALIFDSFYDNHKGVIASVRVFNGEFNANEEAHLVASRSKFKSKEVGTFSPELKPTESIKEGEIGYIATGVKDPEKVKIGDTITFPTKGPRESATFALPGYKEPRPVVFVSFYPEDADENDALKIALQKLKLNDSSITIEPDKNEVLGRGFKVGFLGRLHFEIIAERLVREFNTTTVHTFPSVMYKVKTAKGWQEIINPTDLPEEFLEIWEPMVKVEMILPQEHLNSFFSFQSKFRFQNIENEVLRNRVIIRAIMPLAELMSDFDDQLKSATEGFASFSYELDEYQKSDIVKVDILVSGDLVPGLSRFFHKSAFEREARKMVERLKDLLPKQQFSQPIQAKALGRIIAREDIKALRKNVTGHLYGGDRTRKMKLWKKQKKGKKKLEERAHVRISPDVFKELLKK